MITGPTPDQVATRVALIRRHEPKATVIGIYTPGIWLGGTELRVKAFAVEKEDRPGLGEVHRLLQTGRLERFYFFALLFATLPIGLFARRRFLRPCDSRREYRQRPPQHPHKTTHAQQFTQDFRFGR